MAAHIVKTRSELHFSIPGEFADRSSGYSGDLVVSELGGAVQMGFRVARLEHDGYVATHVHSFEESLFVIDGTLVVDTPDGSHELVSGDYALFP
ncbi:MAG: cupin domain-containing protein, partial [Acidimicrobiia bacterium]|nr:cupin domain-containing protein [Acidimicrobiia bacterium]